MREVKVKSLNFEMKQVGDAGEFEGLAAVYGIRDEAGDVIEQGAFTFTINRHKAKFPMFWQHRLDEPMGFVDVADGEAGLRVRGKLNLEVARARETHALMRQAIAEDHPFGLSFGYDTLRATWQGNTRHLKEIRLYEISPTLIPAQELARVVSVKQMEGKPFGEFEDFDACVAANQDKEDPEAFCAWLHEQITGEFPAEGASLKARVEALLAQKPAVRISREQMKALCPSCADKMAALNISALVLTPEAAKQMPAELLAGLCEKYGGAEGFFTRCQADPPPEVDDPEAFCAWLHEQCHGTFPAEGASLPIKAARHLLGEAARILEARGAATIAARAREVKALLDVDPGIAPSTQDPAAEMALWTLLRQMRDDTRRRLIA